MNFRTNLWVPWKISAVILHFYRWVTGWGKKTIHRTISSWQLSSVSLSLTSWLWESVQSWVLSNPNNNKFLLHYHFLILEDVITCYQNSTFPSRAVLDTGLSWHLKAGSRQAFLIILFATCFPLLIEAVFLQTFWMKLPVIYT